MTEVEGPELAVASGGPLDGAVLGTAVAGRYEVRMADGTFHVYTRSDRPSSGSRLYEYAGRR